MAKHSQWFARHKDALHAVGFIPQPFIHRNCHPSTSETEQVGWEKGTITLLIHEEKCDVCTVQSCRIFTALFQQLCFPANRSNILPVAFIVFSSKIHNKLTHQIIIFQLGESDAYKNYSGVT